jgi:hypothetical protein
VKDTNKSNCLKEEKKANANLSTSQMGLWAPAQKNVFLVCEYAIYHWKLE